MDCVLRSNLDSFVLTPSRSSSPPFSLSSLPRGCGNQAVEEGDSREIVENRSHSTHQKAIAHLSI